MNAIGVDEVGRGCLAGPMLVVAARAKSNLPINMKDSKRLSPRQRQVLLRLIKNSCDLGEGWVSANEIDSLGLTGATKLGVKRSLLAIKALYDEPIIIDGKINYAPSEFINCRAIIKADKTVPIVSAASIYAKVVRDKYMAGIAKTHINYGFDKHMGYGTKGHMAAIEAFGIIDNFHRLSFLPIRNLSSAT